MISRRFLLKIFAAVLSTLPLGERPAMSLLFVRPKEKREPRLREDAFVSKGKALVGVAGRGTVKEMVTDAVNLIGGLERLDIKGRSVLVKPNVVSGEPSPSTTSPEVVSSVVELMYEHGASRVYVGDMSALATLSTKRNMARTGILEAARTSGAEVIEFEDHGWIEVDLPDNEFIKTAYVTEWIYKVDVVVNVPVIKTHRSASYTITLKNFIGCTHLKQRPYLVDSEHWEEIVAEFNAAYAPDLNIVDGTVSMIEGGPWRGTPERTGLVIASGDRVAADVVGLGIIKSFGRWAPVTEKNVWEQKQIKRAVSLGIGRGPEGIRLVTGGGDGVFTELMEKVRWYAGL